ncbi:transcription initiation factor TFIID subunit 2-like [Xenia sp. Carnegie-2017]|uniref:transcription initiation factor TFIID subunit 2-like n=1 Tax=Xenia sp. Carnegie-2017 TaxID=2897299 RepID=UPI001F032E47|nr:transcription initiation factor TFIID subunit 2-like [Xenia sp. Carnegie-2017]
MNSAHVFSFNHGNTSRLWFPCIDSFSEVCTWKIDITVDRDLVAVSSGELIEQVYTANERFKMYSYVLDVPTAASNIAFAVGPFEVHVDPVMPEVAHFCLPGLLPLLKQTTGSLHEVLEFYEESMSCQFPYPSYKQVFVDHSFEETSSYATLAICSTNLLHSSRVIDQAFYTRKILARALARQFFGCYLSLNTWSDSWLQGGITYYLYGLYMKKAFGNNEYRSWIREEMEKVCKYEIEGPGLLPLNNKSFVSNNDVSSDTDSDTMATSGQPSYLHMHPHLTSCKQIEAMYSKAHLVMRLIEMRIGLEPLLQVFNKLLSLAKSAVKSKDINLWKNMLLSTNGFLRSISIVSGKDLNVFVDQWIYRSGVVSFSGHFVFNRKRNIVELDLMQHMKKGCFKYMGPLTVCIQELDGSFKHTVQIEDITSHHELQCHSKSRRNKRKKIPLMTGEEVDIDLDKMDSDSPVLWIRIDPEVNLIRKVSFKQSDFMWHFQLRHERDVIAQAEALENLINFPTRQTMQAFLDVAKQKECFYRIRVDAIEKLAKLKGDAGETWNVHQSLVTIFQMFFGSATCPEIVRYNDFSNFIDYFVQKAIVSSIGFCRDQHSQCPKAVRAFLLNLLKYNDNRLNRYSDSYYVSSIVNGLINSITPTVPIVNTSGEGTPTLKLSEECRLVLSEITKYLNLEKLLPSYKYVVTSSCLKGLRFLQINAHIPSDPDVFQYYSKYGHFEDVRLTAIECLADIIQADSNEDVLGYLLNLAEIDPSSFIRHFIIQKLTENPPFTKKSNSRLDTLYLVNKLWTAASKSSFDTRLRCDYMDLYNTLWGRVSPGCVPAQGMGVLIDLKEKRITNFSSLNTPSGSKIFEEGDVKSEDRSKLNSETIVKDIQPLRTESDISSAVSVEPPSSGNSKLKLKIKLGEEDENSGINQGITDRDGAWKTHAEGGDHERKKHKKKKKKKHKEDHINN